MNLFKCSPEVLTPFIARSPYQYEAIRDFLISLKGKGVVSNEIEGGLEKTIALMEKADEIAKNSEHFAFSIYDGWAERTGGIEEGLAVFQKVGDDMVTRIGLESGGVCEISTAVELLKKQGIKRIFTLDPPIEGYFGVKSYTDEDGDSVTYKEIDNQTIEYLNENGIEVIRTPR